MRQVSQRHASLFFSLCLHCAMQMWHFCQGQHSAWTKQGGARVFTAGRRWETWLAGGKGGEKNPLLSPFLIVLFLWWCWLLIYVCLSPSSSRQGLFYPLFLCSVKTSATLCYHNNSNDSGIQCEALICYISSEPVFLQKSPVSACAERSVWTW